MIENIVIGTPLANPKHLFSSNDEEWEQYIKDEVYYTDERYLPRLLVECGIVKSTSEVRRNQPHLVRYLNEVDFIKVKWGKRFIWIMIGE